MISAPSGNKSTVMMAWCNSNGSSCQLCNVYTLDGNAFVPSWEHIHQTIFTGSDSLQGHTVNMLAQ